MQAEVVWITPTTDVHLLLAGGKEPVHLDLWSALGEVPTNVSAHADTSLSGFDGTIVTAAKDLSLTPKAVGETIGKVTFKATNATFELLVRVRVHEDIDTLWLGNEQVTLYNKETGYQLSTYARFNDQTRGDITNHPYLSFSALDLSVSPPDSAVKVDPSSGMLTAKSEGDAQVTVSYASSHGTLTDSVKVHVAPLVGSGPQQLQLIFGTGEVSERKNILLLAEGFANDVVFDEWSREFAHRLLYSPSHCPYDMLRSSFNIWAFSDTKWSTYHPQPEEGITVGPEVILPPIPPRKYRFSIEGTPVTREEDDEQLGKYTLAGLVARVGLPGPFTATPGSLNDAKGMWVQLEPFDKASFKSAGKKLFEPDKLSQTIFDAWLELADYGPLQVKNSRFGLIHGGRLGARSAQSFTSAAKPASLEWPNLWYRPYTVHRVIVSDSRRSSLSVESLDKLFGTLKFGVPTKKDGQKNVDYDVGLTWIENTGNFKKSHSSPPQYLGKDKGLICLIAKDDVYGGGRLPTFFGVTLGANSSYTITSRNPRLTHEPTLGAVVIEERVDTMAHEFGHALGLADEYENDGSGGAGTTLTDANAGTIAQISASGNVMVFKDASDKLTSGIDPNNIKWNWDRIRLASPLAVAASNAANNTIEVPLKKGEGKRWIKEKGNSQAKVYLRRIDIYDPKKITEWRLGPLSIDPSSTPETDKLVLKGGQVTAANPFPAGSTVYIAKVDGSRELRIINESLRLSLTTPFGRLDNCEGTQHSQDKEYPFRNILDLPDVLFGQEKIALYEGGARWNCLVYRPAGMCKMRVNTGGQPFCFVCKYILVDEIDASKHGLLDDRKYP